MAPEAAFLIVGILCFIMFLSTGMVMETIKNKQQRRKDRKWKKQ